MAKLSGTLRAMGQVEPGSSCILLVDPATGQSYPSAPDGTVLLASARHGWRGILAELHRIPPMEMDDHRLIGHRLVVATGRHATPFGWKEGGRVREAPFKPGDFSLQTHGDSNAPRWQMPFEFMSFSLDPGFVAEVAGERLPPNRIEFQSRRIQADPVVTQFSKAFHTELAQGNSNSRIYAEAMAVGFTLHLLAWHGVHRPRSLAPRGKLSSFQVRRVVDYVQTHLGQPFGLLEMASQANLSTFHFARLFRTTLGMPPHHFVLRLRVERAKTLLATARLDLAQVALDTGFSDQAHLTHTFRRFVGVTPKIFSQGSRA